MTDTNGNSPSLRARLRHMGFPEDADWLRFPTMDHPYTYSYALEVVPEKIDRFFTERRLLAAPNSETPVHRDRLKVEIQGKVYVTQPSTDRWRDLVIRVGRPAATILVTDKGAPDEGVVTEWVNPADGIYPLVSSDSTRRPVTNPEAVKGCRYRGLSPEARARTSPLGEPTAMQILVLGHWTRVYQRRSGTPGRTFDYLARVGGHAVTVDESTLSRLQVSAYGR